MVTIYQLYINGMPSKYVFKSEVEAIELKDRISILYKVVTVESFDVPQK